MVPPVRWYFILSTWIFILSVLYPIHKISTFPLNCLALAALLVVLLNPFKESYVKNIYIAFVHIAPFLWIPYDFSYTTLVFSVCVILIYLLALYSIDENPYHIYIELLSEHHRDAKEFIKDRFGINL